MIATTPSSDFCRRQPCCRLVVERRGVSLAVCLDTNASSCWGWHEYATFPVWNRMLLLSCILEKPQVQSFGIDHGRGAIARRPHRRRIHPQDSGAACNQPFSVSGLPVIRSRTKIRPDFEPNTTAACSSHPCAGNRSGSAASAGRSPTGRHGPSVDPFPFACGRVQSQDGSGMAMLERGAVAYRSTEELAIGMKTVFIAAS